MRKYFRYFVAITLFDKNLRASWTDFTLLLLSWIGIWPVLVLTLLVIKLYSK